MSTPEGPVDARPPEPVAPDWNPIRRKWRGVPVWAWIIGAVVVTGVITSVLTAPGRAAQAEADRQAQIARIAEAMAPVDVEYEVEGSATSVNITMETPSGTSQGSDKAVPLRTDAGNGITLSFSRGSFVYISAQNQGESGTVTCRITVDGKIISENTSSGAYSIASCDGQA